MQFILTKHIAVLSMELRVYFQTQGTKAAFCVKNRNLFFQSKLLLLCSQEFSILKFSLLKSYTFFGVKKKFCFDKIRCWTGAAFDSPLQSSLCLLQQNYVIGGEASPITLTGHVTRLSYWLFFLPLLIHFSVGQHICKEPQCA